MTLDDQECRCKQLLEVARMLIDKAEMKIVGVSPADRRGKRLTEAFAMVNVAAKNLYFCAEEIARFEIMEREAAQRATTANPTSAG